MRRMIAFARIGAAAISVPYKASEPVGNTHEEYAAFINEEIILWRAVIKQANVKTE